MTDTRGLFVIWREPTSAGRRHVVGRLWQSQGQYHFTYEPDLTQARASGFQLLVEFPSATEHYRSGYLFPTFAQRIPVPARPDHARLMASWGVERPDDKLEILGRSGGLQLTDRIELSPWRDPHGPLDEPLELRVAGARHRDNPPFLAPGTVVTLQAEPDNQADPDAVRVESIDGAVAGYVPRQYSSLVARAIRGGVVLAASVVRTFLEPESEHPRAVIRIEPVIGSAQRR